MKLIRLKFMQDVRNIHFANQTPIYVIAIDFTNPLKVHKVNNYAYRYFTDERDFKSRATPKEILNMLENLTKQMDGKARMRYGFF